MNGFGTPVMPESSFFEEESNTPIHLLDAHEELFVVLK